MAVICHTLTVLTDPGSLNYDIVDKLGAKERADCGKCVKNRPQRAHHCSVCGRCFMKMDHHCPWVFNCVGFANQKIFFIFVCYTNIGCITALGMFIGYLCSNSFRHLFDVAKNRKLDFAQNNMRIFGDHFKKIGDIIMAIGAPVIVLFTLCSVSVLLLSQIYLISRNITNIESDAFRGRDENNPYFMSNNKCFAMRIVLGLNEKWKWLFPIVEPNKYNGGYIYESPVTLKENK